MSFVTPDDGEEVTNPVAIEMEAEDLGIRPTEDNAGHLHVLIDREPVEPGDAIPFEDGYAHYGDGELEDDLDLEPGEHDLVLLAGDDYHVAYDLTDEGSITVAEE